MAKFSAASSTTKTASRRVEDFHAKFSHKVGRITERGICFICPAEFDQNGHIIKRATDGRHVVEHVTTVARYLVSKGTVENPDLILLGHAAIFAASRETNIDAVFKADQDRFLTLYNDGVDVGLIPSEGLVNAYPALYEQVHRYAARWAANLSCGGCKKSFVRHSTLLRHCQNETHQAIKKFKVTGVVSASHPCHDAPQTMFPPSLVGGLRFRYFGESALLLF